MSGSERLVLPEVAVAFMNADHAQAVEVIEQLSALASHQGSLADSSRQAIKDLLEELFARCRGQAFPLIRYTEASMNVCWSRWTKPAGFGTQRGI
ncbi:MAG: hypothetical protein GYB21_03340 [Oceanospirillales bacterium]|nr:hypothetical protein [Oceanospirillales bacterium]